MTTEAPRILYLEDGPLDVELVQRKLQQGGLLGDLRVAPGRAEYEAALADGGFDLILSDYNLPDYDGMTALALARELQPEVPFILISGAVGEEQAVDCVLRGATDYVLKQRLDRLVPAAERALAEAEQLRKRRAAEEALHIRNHALASSLSAVAMSDPEGNLTYVNQAFLDLCGHPDSTPGARPALRGVRGPDGCRGRHLRVGPAIRTVER